MNFKKLIINLFNVCAIIVLLVSGTKIVGKAIDLRSSKKMNENLREISSEYETLKNVNSDYQLWLKVENTEIDYPVVQAKDNEFYLNKNFKKEENVAGIPFMDYRNDFLNDKNTIFYAHHMKNGSMFADLEKFKDEDFFKNNKNVYIKTKDKSLKFEVFSVYVQSNQTDYLQVEFDDDVQYSNYLKKAMNKSMYKSDLNVDAKDKIITFSTCSYEFKNARTVVHAKLVEEKNI